MLEKVAVSFKQARPWKVPMDESHSGVDKNDARTSSWPEKKVSAWRILQAFLHVARTGRSLKRVNFTLRSSDDTIPDSFQWTVSRKGQLLIILQQ